MAMIDTERASGSRSQGRASVFSLARPVATMRLFTVADQLLEATGEAVVLCENYGAAALHETEKPA
jgi:ArsR family transcriptional regulator, cadmium/lead-responsive transcriptional repressor